MIIEHRGKCPRIHESVYVAPNATLSGDVSIGENSCVLFGAVISAEGSPISIGSHCIIMENVVIRASTRHPTTIHNNILVGPRSYLTGCTIEDNAFLATGTTVFNGARIGARAEVRVNGVVHLKTVLFPDAVVPIGWIAVGDPAEILPLDAHERIWTIQKELNFPKEVFGMERPLEGKTIMPELMKRYTRALLKHNEDTEIECGVAMRHDGNQN